jgi:hypothetical protein
MRAVVHALIALASVVAGSAGTSAASAAGVVVHVQRPHSVAQSVHVSFSAAPLPNGGYYYAVIVLEPYRHYTRSSPPPCATSSNMQRTDYGYPRASSRVALAITPAHSATGHWCRGGTYSGAIYAVPHAPRAKAGIRAAANRTNHRARAGGSTATSSAASSPCPTSTTTPTVCPRRSRVARASSRASASGFRARSDRSAGWLVPVISLRTTGSCRYGGAQGGDNMFRRGKSSARPRSRSSSHMPEPRSQRARARKRSANTSTGLR